MKRRVHRLPFRPFPLLAQRDVQTIVAARVGAGRPPPSELLTLPLGDGDALALAVSTPPGWDPSARTVLLLHGLCGCSRSPYNAGCILPGSAPCG